MTPPFLVLLTSSNLGESQRLATHHQRSNTGTVSIGGLQLANYRLFKHVPRTQIYNEIMKGEKAAFQSGAYVKVRQYAPGPNSGPPVCIPGVTDLKTVMCLLQVLVDVG